MIAFSTIQLGINMVYKTCWGYGEPMMNGRYYNKQLVITVISRYAVTYEANIETKIGSLHIIYQWFPKKLENVYKNAVLKVYQN